MIRVCPTLNRVRTTSSLFDFLSEDFQGAVISLYGKSYREAGFFSKRTMFEGESDIDSDSQQHVDGSCWILLWCWYMGWRGGG